LSESTKAVVLAAVALATAALVPFALIGGAAIVLNMPVVKPELRNLSPIAEYMGMLLLPASAGVGFFGSVSLLKRVNQVWPRSILIAAAALYFPVMCYLLLYWTISLAGGI